MNLLAMVAGVSGILTLFFAVIFIYYSYKNALVLRDSLGKYLTALGSFFFMMPGFIDGIRVSGATIQEALRVLSFLLFFIGLILMLNGGIISFFSFYKESKNKSSYELLKTQPNGRYVIFGYLVLIFIAFPFFLLSLLTGLRTTYGWIAMMGVLFSYSSFGIGERKLYSKLTSSSSLENLPEKNLLFLKEEIYTLRLFISLSNEYLCKIKSITGDNNLRKFLSSEASKNLRIFTFDNLDIEDLKFSEKNTREKLQNIKGENKKEILMSDFSNLLEVLVDYFGKSTTISYTKSELKNSFESIKNQVGENPIVFDILRCLPKGVIEEERFSLLSRKELESKVRKRTAELENILDTMVDVLIKIDHEGTIELVNDSLYDILGYDKEDIIGHKPNKLFVNNNEKSASDKISNWDEICQKVYKKGYVKDYETFFITKEGETIPISFSGSRMDLKESKKFEKPGMVCVGKDIRERKEAEERTEFLHSLLRHDLGNKLQITMGFLELLGEMDFSDEHKEYIEDSLNSIEEGIELIGNIRTLNNIESKDIKTKPVKLEKTVKESLRRYRDLATQLDFEMYNEIESKVSVEGGLLLKELFSNLIENSLKHSKGSLIRISDEELDKKVKVTIEDNGKGIPDDIKDRITEKGFQGEESSGSGLGMHLVKRIVESYDSEFIVKDSELGGAKFDLILKKCDF